jgi:hypothetical protein
VCQRKLWDCNLHKVDTVFPIENLETRLAQFLDLANLLETMPKNIVLGTPLRDLEIQGR